MPKKSTARYSPRANRDNAPLPFRPVGVGRPRKVHVPVVSATPTPPPGVRRSVGVPFNVTPVPPGIARINGAQPKVRRSVPMPLKVAAAAPRVTVQTTPPSAAPGPRIQSVSQRIIRQETTRPKAAAIKWTPPAWNGDETPTFRG